MRLPLARPELRVETVLEEQVIAALPDLHPLAAKAELRLKTARKSIQDWRDKQNQVDPTQAATAQMGLLSTLQSSLAQQEADLASVGSFLARDAPSVKMMQNRADALRKQINDEKVKHDTGYQARRGILQGPAKDLSPELYARIQRTAKRIYRTLGLDGYARIDFRLAADGTPYFIEANPNPEIAKSQEFATAARHDGLDYPDLLNRIVTLGISRAKAGASVG